MMGSGIDFVYHPRAFRTPDGSRYTPDFYLPETDEYIELKGFDRGPQISKRHSVVDSGVKLIILHRDDLRDVLGVNPETIYAMAKKMTSTFGITDYIAGGFYMDTEDLLEFRKVMKVQVVAN